jgi:hypothetical protein
MKRHCSVAASAGGKPDIASAIEIQAASFIVISDLFPIPVVPQV